MRSERIRCWGAVVPALFVPSVAALFYFMICRDAVVARWLYVAAKVFLLAWPLVAWPLLLRRRPCSWRPQCGNRPRAALAGLISGAAISLFIVAVMLTPLGRLVTASADSIRERSEHLGIMEHYWAFALFLSFAHSLIEEYYWRWFAYGALRRVVSPLAAAAISAIAFGSHHVIITGQLMNWPLGIVCGIGIAAGGFIWALLYRFYHSLFAPWISHMVIDLTVMTIGYWVLVR